jgi:translation initiation factor IF-1
MAAFIARNRRRQPPGLHFAGNWHRGKPPSGSATALFRHGLLSHGNAYAAAPRVPGLMPKEEIIRIEGEITEILPDGRFRVKLENEHEIIAYTAGKMRKNRIRSIVGDRVHVEMIPYDLDKGRIVFREKSAPMPMNQRRFFRR